MTYVLYMTSPNSFDPILLEQILQAAAPISALEQLCCQQQVKLRRGIYSLVVVIWLMIYQRLQAKRTLAATVHFLGRQAMNWRQWPEVGKRIREGRISSHTGGYCQARQKMPTLVASSVCDYIFEQLQKRMRQPLPDVSRPVFIIDGTTLQLAHERDLVRAFPPGRNQHGNNHWPTMLLVAFHDVQTGLAARPSWGATYGAQAVSEQELARQALERLPADALVLADRNFGIFAFAYAVQQSQRPVVLRLTAVRAHKLLAGEVLRPGRRRRVVWEVSRWDRQGHPSLPAGAVVKGWMIACRNPANPQELLYFFTDLEVKPKRILALYKLRWNIETDLRSLKRTVELHRLSSRSKEMVEKELLMAICAYNVVRAVMYLSASSAGLRTRQLSFSNVQ